jgi:5'-nucleotidase
METNNSTLTFLHFNDVYEIGEREKEPVGGIARFKTALNQFSELNPITLFSGDLFSPSSLSIITHGEHMVMPMNKFGTNVACLGNHDLDIDLEHLHTWIDQSTYPWLLSNVIDKHTNDFICGSKEYFVMERQGFKLGFFGLAEYDWILTLNTLTPEEVIYEDFIVCAKRMNEFLRKEKNCDIVIALTHMRNHNDEKLAKSYDGLDLILGGHDHVHLIEQLNGTYVIKSGCEFREFNKISLKKLSKEEVAKLQKEDPDKLYKEKYTIDIETVEITKKFDKDKEMEEFVESYLEKLRSSMEVPLGITHVDLETRFDKIRTSE